ncbi:MAG TPA: response regulator transcription factor [Chitinophagales bacterium]|nr:response regulator transcription factor [Chitinophagales bacterium]
MNIRVLVYDDNKGRQAALQLLIDNTEDMTCVGTFDNCSHVMEQVDATQPHVVLMDIDMPTVNGIEGLKLIRKHSPDVLVVMQTVFEQDEKIFEAIRSGAHGYFLKKTTSAKLVEGIRDVCNGGAPMTSIVARKVLHMFHHQNAVNPKNHFDLTERELEVLSHLVKGLSYKMIADAAGITYHTVNSHCKKIYEKLHVHSATEAVAKAIEHRIV